MKIGIMATTGKLGAAILDATIQLTSTKNVIALARSPHKIKRKDVETRAGDYEAPSQLIESLRGIDSLLIVSGNSSPDIRIEQHRNIIRAAKESGVKKIVYTSIQGAVNGNTFSPIVQSNRQTEKDIQESGLEWCIGRNGIYIEPDIEYLQNYIKAGEIVNSAHDGKCGYVLREELAYAYARLLSEETHNSEIFNLNAPPITQYQLVSLFNNAFNINLKYRSITSQEYLEERKAQLGPALGNIIAGIYDGIRSGSVHYKSDFEKVAQRVHIPWDKYLKSLSQTS